MTDDDGRLCFFGPWRKVDHLPGTVTYRCPGAPGQPDTAHYFDRPHTIGTRPAERATCAEHNRTGVLIRSAPAVTFRGDGWTGGGSKRRAR